VSQKEMIRENILEENYNNQKNEVKCEKGECKDELEIKEEVKE
jgi:hypothetical protein